MYFHPNVCFICKTTESLKRCTRCNMISYCGSNHQKEHFPLHKKICKVISIFMEGKNHLFEDFKRDDTETWFHMRQQSMLLVERALRRPLESDEKEMFGFPRVCFVCRETRQNLLTDCVGCRSTSFCEKHSSSPLHDQDCADLKRCFDLETSWNEIKRMGLSASTNYLIDATKIYKSLKPFTSMKEYLDQNLKEDFFDFSKPNILRLWKYSVLDFFSDDLMLPKVEVLNIFKEDFPELSNPSNIPEILEDMKIRVSENLTSVLTMYSALEKLKYQPGSKMILHVCNVSNTHPEYFNFWELLLHLLPNVNILKVLVVVTPEDAETKRLKIKVCAVCSSKKKKLIVETKTIAEMAAYRKNLEDRDSGKPNMVAVLNGIRFDDPDELRDFWFKFGCPIVFTTNDESKWKATSETFRSSYWGNDICYDGINEFGCMWPSRNPSNGRIIKLDRFMTVTKARSKKD